MLSHRSLRARSPQRSAISAIAGRRHRRRAVAPMLSASAVSAPLRSETRKFFRTFRPIHICGSALIKHCSASRRDCFLLHIEASITDPGQISTPPPRLLAQASDYESLRNGLRSRAAELGISRQTIDHVGRFPDGHAGGLLAENSNRSFGIKSLGKILRALGVRLLLVEDPETTARTLRLMFGRKRSEPQAVEGKRHWRSKRKPSKPMRAAAHGSGKNARPVSVSELGQRGARALNSSRTAAERSAAAQRAAKARWQKRDTSPTVEARS
jgi:hypothetical protein